MSRCPSKAISEIESWTSMMVMPLRDDFGGGGGGGGVRHLALIAEARGRKEVPGLLDHGSAPAGLQETETTSARR